MRAKPAIQHVDALRLGCQTAKAICDAVSSLGSDGCQVDTHTLATLMILAMDEIGKARHAGDQLYELCGAEKKGGDHAA